MSTLVVRSNHSKHANPIVLGVGRSGTSFFALLLKTLGYYLGDSHNPYHEDPRLYEPGPTRYSVLRSDYARHERWGVKLPSMAFDLPKALPYFDNPCFLVVCRSPISTIKSMRRRSNHPEAPALQLFLDAQAEIYNQVLNTSVPTILLDFEQCLSNPLKAASALIDFLNLSRDLLDIVNNDLRSDQRGYRLHKGDPAATVGQKLADVTDLYPVDTTSAVSNSCELYVQRRIRCLFELIDDFLLALHLLSNDVKSTLHITLYREKRQVDADFLTLCISMCKHSQNTLSCWRSTIDRLDAFDFWWRQRRVAAQRILDGFDTDCDLALLQLHSV